VQIIAVVFMISGRMKQVEEPVSCRFAAALAANTEEWPSAEARRRVFKPTHELMCEGLPPPDIWGPARQWGQCVKPIPLRPGGPWPGFGADGRVLGDGIWTRASSGIAQLRHLESLPQVSTKPIRELPDVADHAPPAMLSTVMNDQLYLAAQLLCLGLESLGLVQRHQRIGIELADRDRRRVCGNACPAALHG
jgi:hypothetical protein